MSAFGFHHSPTPPLHHFGRCDNSQTTAFGLAAGLGWSGADAFYLGYWGLGAARLVLLLALTTLIGLLIYLRRQRSASSERKGMYEPCPTGHTGNATTSSADVEHQQQGAARVEPCIHAIAWTLFGMVLLVVLSWWCYSAVVIMAGRATSATGTMCQDLWK
jgi:hypothetical protein